MRRKFLAVLLSAGLAPIVLSAEDVVNPLLDWGPATDGLRIALSPAAARLSAQRAEFDVVFQNVGSSDILLNLGAIYGRRHHLLSLGLTLTSPGGETRQLLFGIDSEGAVIRGRIDDMIVALPRGSTYVVKFDLSRLPTYPKVDLKFGGYTLKARYEGKDSQFPNPAAPNLSVWDFWKGVAQSNVVAFEVR